MLGHKYLMAILTAVVVLSFYTEPSDAAAVGEIHFGHVLMFDAKRQTSLLSVKTPWINAKNLEHCMKWKKQNQPLDMTSKVFKNYLHLLSLCVSALPLTR